MDEMKNIDQEFLHTLHIEKIRTQNERAELVKKKLAFITVFFWDWIRKLWILGRRSLLAPIFCTFDSNML
jgi:hypothetical protein